MGREGPRVRSQGRPQMAHPDHLVRPDAPGEIPQMEPVYPLTAGLSPKALRRAIEGAMQRIPRPREWISAAVMQQKNWPDFGTAMNKVHYPENAEDLLPAAPARARLAYDELLANQLALALVDDGRRDCGDVE